MIWIEVFFLLSIVLMFINSTLKKSNKFIIGLVISTYIFYIAMYKYSYLNSIHVFKILFVYLLFRILFKNKLTKI